MSQKYQANAGLKMAFLPKMTKNDSIFEQQRPF